MKEERQRGEMGLSPGINLFRSDGKIELDGLFGVLTQYDTPKQVNINPPSRQEMLKITSYPFKSSSQTRLWFYWKKNIIS